MKGMKMIVGLLVVGALVVGGYGQTAQVSKFPPLPSVTVNDLYIQIGQLQVQAQKQGEYIQQIQQLVIELEKDKEKCRDERNEREKQNENQNK